MRAPVNRMKKAEIVWLGTHTCRHGHTYLEHYNCYLTEVGVHKKIGIFDIETSNLDANFGVVFVASIKLLDGDEIETVRIRQEDSKYRPEQLDYRVVKEIINILNTYDVIVTYYGKRFDIPFLRTRAIMLNLEFPEYGTLKHIDVYDWAKRMLRFRGKKMSNVERILFGDTLKTHIEFKHWLGAVRLNEPDINYIVDHNIKDVLSLERVYKELSKYARPVESSI